MTEDNYHSLDGNELAKVLGTKLDTGLTTAEAEERLRKHGANELQKEEPESLWQKIKEQFEDLLVRLLLGAAVISFLIAQFGHHEEEHSVPAWVEPLVIFTILIANAVVGIWQDYDAENALEALKELQSEKAFVLRDGKWGDLASRELVIGDVVQIAQGDKVPADIRLVELKTLTIRLDQAALTGESNAVVKDTTAIKTGKKMQIPDNHNTAFAGTLVANGLAIGVVVRTGMKTELGVIQSSVLQAKADTEDTPLKKKLNEFGELLARVVLFICVFIWLINYKNFSDPAFHGSINGALYYFKIAVALAVAAIPEGLPAVITTCLALGTRRMAKQNAIVRKLPSVETLGCTTVICSDKTGTLTTNEMVVEQFLLFGDSAQDIKAYQVKGISYQPEGEIIGFNKGDANKENVKQFAQCMAICNEATLLRGEKRIQIKGLPTEAALRVLVEKIGRYDAGYAPGADIQGYNTQILNSFKKAATLEFSRERKSMSVLANVDGKQNHLFIKGAPDYIIQKARNVVLSNGKLVALDANLRNQLLQSVQKLANQGLRTLAICKKEDIADLATYNGEKHPAHAQLLDSNNYAKIESESTILGVVAVRDPPREEVKGSIQKCKEAGIAVIMITGDIKETAQSIGREIGIVHDDYKERSYTGLEFFEEKTVDARKKILRDNIQRGGDGMIFARTEPKHKQALVKLLKGLNHIVAMTGDGVNDAPALQEANIGVAMGIAGTEVAKEASAMVLSDDNFATIVRAVEEGRSIYSNMKAFIRYMISSNIGEVISIFLTSILGIPDGLSSIQLLWVNLVTDGLPATALCFNPTETGIMNRPPRKHDEPIITGWIFFRYFIVGTYVGATTVGIFIYWYLYYQSPDGHTLVTFDQLRNWSECKNWSNFKVAKFSTDYDFYTKNPCAYFTVGKEKASTLSLSVMVIIEMCNALNAISEEQSLLKTGIFGNGWLILAIFSSIGLHFVLIHVGFLGDIFGVVPLTLDEWKIVILFSLPVILIDEILKIFARIRSARLAASYAIDQKTD